MGLGLIGTEIENIGFKNGEHIRKSIIMSKNQQ